MLIPQLYRMEEFEKAYEVSQGISGESDYASELTTNKIAIRAAAGLVKGLDIKVLFLHLKK